MNETESIKKFKGDNGGLVLKLHGSQYQSCLPDIIWIKRGSVQFLEFKKIDNRTVPVKSWRPGQHAMLLMMRRAGASVFYCIYSEKVGGFFMVSPEEVNPEQPYEIPKDEPVFKSCAKQMTVQ